MNDDAAARFLKISPYVSPPADMQPSLQGNIHADVVIVGGGYTGLSTALALHERGVASVILERDFCGFGASGRNAGHLTPTISKDLPTAVKIFGRETAANLACYADFCVENAEQMMKTYGIDCDYNQSGNIMSVVHPKQIKRLREATTAAAALGAKMHFVEPGEMRERGMPKAFLCGSMEEAGGTLHTGKFVLGLRKAALDRGIRIYEQTSVEHIYEYQPIRVVTKGGTVTADKLVMACNAYTPELGGQGARLAPLYISLFETSPLSQSQLDAIGGWKGREGIYTAHESMESYRLTAQRTIIGGSKDVQYFYDCAPHNHGGEADARKMSVIRAFRERFPELDELPMAHAWAGWCGFTLDFMPLVGRAPDNANCFHAVGFNGHGVAQATAMGELLADMMLGKENPWHKLVFRTPAYMPPKPLRYLSIKFLLSILNGADRRLDKKLRARAQTS